MGLRFATNRFFMRRRNWLAVITAAAVILSGTFGPWNEIAHGAPNVAISEIMDAASADPCCDDCPANYSTCNDSALCMAKCGKLPMHLGAPLGVKAPAFTSRIALAAAPDLPDRQPSPLRRPPKQV
jgi:hypothetical protein